MDNNITNKKYRYSPIFWGSFFISLGIGLLIIQVIHFPINIISFSSAFAITLLLLGLSFLKFSRLIKQILIGLVGVLLSFIILMFISSIKTSFSSFVYHFVDNNNDYSEIESSFSNKDIFPKSTLNLNGSLLEVDISDISTSGFKINYSSPKSFRVNYDSLSHSYEVQGESIGLMQNLSPATGRIQLSDSTIWNIKSNISSSDLVGKLENIKISNIFLTSTESIIELELGAKSPQVEVLLESEKSDLSLKIPYDAYCEITSNIRINTFSIEDFKEIYPGFYSLGDSSNCSTKIKITLTGKLSDLKISRVR